MPGNRKIDFRKYELFKPNRLSKKNDRAANREFNQNPFAFIEIIKEILKPIRKPVNKPTAE